MCKRGAYPTVDLLERAVDLDSSIGTIIFFVPALEHDLVEWDIRHREP